MATQPIASTEGIDRAAYPARVPDLIRDDEEALAVARRVAAEFAVDAALRDRERRLPWAELDAFVQSGLWGITVPREFGGAGVSNGTLAEVVAIISAADGSLGQIPQNHYYALEVLRVGGSHAQQRFFFERVLAGERFGNALAEIGHKDFKRRTRLTRTPGGWRVDGRKFYCTGALYAHWIPDTCDRRRRGSRRFLSRVRAALGSGRHHHRRLGRLRPARDGQRIGTVRARCCAARMDCAVPEFVRPPHDQFTFWSPVRHLKNAGK